MRGIIDGMSALFFGFVAIYILAMVYKFIAMKLRGNGHIFSYTPVNIENFGVCLRFAGGAGAVRVPVCCMPAAQSC